MTNMNAEALLQQCVDLAKEKKAKNIAANRIIGPVGKENLSLPNHLGTSKDK